MLGSLENTKRRRDRRIFCQGSHWTLQRVQRLDGAWMLCKVLVVVIPCLLAVGPSCRTKTMP